MQLPLGLLAHLADGALAVLPGLLGLVADALDLLSGLAAHRGHGVFGFVAGGFAVLLGLLARVLGGLVLVVAFLAGAFRSLDGALALADAITSVSPAVVAAVKAGLRCSLRDGAEAGRVAEPQLAALIRELPDGDEGVSSFLERRRPSVTDHPNDFHDQIAEVLA